MVDVAPAVARMLGVELASWRIAGDGQGRTAFAEMPDGRPVVVKWFPGRQRPLAENIRLVETLRRRGYPAPATLAHGPVGPHGQGCVQERLPGEPCTGGLSRPLLDRVIAAVALQADADEVAEEGWSYSAAVVFDDEEGCWQAARARGAGAICDALSRWVRELPRPPVRRDFIHLDLNFTNILARGDTLTGIVDLDHLGAGDDRSVDLVSLVFDYEQLRIRTGAAPPPGAVELVRGTVEAISGEAGWRQAVTFRAIADLAWTALDGRRLPLEETTTVIRAVMEPAG